MFDVLNFDSEMADMFFDEMPEVGEEVEFQECEYIITGIEIINKKEMNLKVETKREVKRFEDPKASSINWEKLPERFLGGKDNNKFIEENTFKGGSKQ